MRFLGEEFAIAAVTWSCPKSCMGALLAANRVAGLETCPTYGGLDKYFCAYWIAATFGTSHKEENDAK